MDNKILATDDIEWCLFNQACPVRATHPDTFRVNVHPMLTVYFARDICGPPVILEPMVISLLVHRLGIVGSLGNRIDSTIITFAKTESGSGVRGKGRINTPSQAFWKRTFRG